MTRITLRQSLILWALVGVGVMMPMAQQIKDPDLWLHLSTGRLILQSRNIPVHDPFTFTSQAGSYAGSSWLSDVITYSFHTSFGLAGIVMLRTLLVFLTTFSLYLFAKRRTNSELAGAGVAVLSAVASSSAWNQCSQLFSYLLLISLLRLVDRWRRGGSIWAVVPLFTLWINLHSGWWAGFVVLTVVLAEECVISVKAGKTGRVGHLVLVYASAFAALFLNPSGAATVKAPLQYFALSTVTGYAASWKSPLEHLAVVWPSFAIVAALLLLIFWSRTKTRFSERLFAVGSALASLITPDALPVFAILAIPVASAQVRTFSDRPRKNRKLPREYVIINLGLLLTLFVFLYFSMPVNKGDSQLVNIQNKPVASAQYLWPKEVIGGGRIASPVEWRGYLIFKLYPSYKVVGITDAGPIPGNADLVIWPKDWYLAEKLEKKQGWIRIYSDRNAVIYVRTAVLLPD